MRYVLLLLCASLALSIGFLPDTAAEPAQPKGLVVHEWGVINKYADLELANADLRATWEGLPKFVYGQIDSRLPALPGQPAVVPVLAPIIYFHSPQATDVTVKVEFPGGKPAVWWPTHGNIARNPDQTLRDKFLTWQLQVKSPAAERVAEMTLPKGHWMEACRAVKADDVLARTPEGTPQRERFVYYDGLIPAPKGVELTVAAAKVALKNQATHAVLDLTVVDRRVPDKVRVGRAAKLEAGAEIKELEFADREPKNWPAAGAAELLGQLKEAGLFEDEAKALLEVWRKDLFETEGLTLFYRLPQGEYDRLLPLTVTPKPESTVRVLLIHQPHCEPDLADKVAGLVKQLGADEFEQRIQAHKRLHGLGRAAFVHLLRARKATQDPEVRARLQKLLEEFESEQAFRK